MSAENTGKGKNSKNVVRIEPSKLFGIAEIMFDQGKKVVLTVTGNSMYPFLRNNTDSVEICRAGINDIKVSDIVLIKRDDSYILHRVFKKTVNEFYMIGDAQDNLDGPYDKSHLIGKVTAIIRNGKIIPCTSSLMNVFVRVWMILRPVRLPIIRGYTKIRNRTGNKKSKKV